MNAAEVMNKNVVSVRPDTSIVDAAKIMLQEKISGLPVVDRNGRLVGIISEGDLIRRSELITQKKRPSLLEFVLGPGPVAADYTRSHSRLVQDVMTTNLITATEDENLSLIVRKMEKHRIKRIPIIRGTQLVGIITRANLLHALVSVLSDVKPTTAADWAVRDQIIAELDSQSWAPLSQLTITVRKGIVDLCGVIFEERQRAALISLAANVPGVKKVNDHVVLLAPQTGYVLFDPDQDRKRAAY